MHKRSTYTEYRNLSQVVTRSANSCLKPLGSCSGLAITTAEGLGSSNGENHPIAERLHKLHGSQCGYCTPGMVMGIYSALKGSHPAGITMAGMEAALDGNICRCTGYRPILDAAHSFARDSNTVDHMNRKGCKVSSAACQWK